jgi:hypothetical protein
MLIHLALGTLFGLNPASPIKLATCEVSTPIVQQSDNGSATFGTYALHVRFSNETQQPISRVLFVLNDGTKVSDVGTFSPGVTINHLLAIEDTGATSCSATEVEFATGVSHATL